MTATPEGNQVEGHPVQKPVSDFPSVSIIPLHI